MMNNLTYQELKEKLVDLPDSLKLPEAYIPNLKYTIDILFNSIDIIPEELRNKSSVCKANKHLLQKIYNELNK
jgi:hypothetical protein